MNSQSEWAAVVLAAGKGTRMKSNIPKVMHPLLGKPMIWYVLRLLKDLEVKKVVAVTGHGAELVDKYISSMGISSVRQDEQLGTGHAVLCTQEALLDFQGNVLILCGDTPLLRKETIQNFIKGHMSSGAKLSVLSARFKDPTGYGRILRDRTERQKVLGIVEEKDASHEEKSINEINTGIYAVDKERLFAWLEQVGCDNAQGEYYLTDIVGLAVREGAPVRAMDIASEEESLGVNSRSELARAERILLDRIIQDHMARGVTFSMPATTYIEPEVELGSDVFVGPHVILKGSTRVGEGVFIGAFSVLEDVQIKAREEVLPYSYIKKRP